MKIGQIGLFDFSKLDRELSVAGIQLDVSPLIASGYSFAFSRV